MAYRECITRLAQRIEALCRGREDGPRIGVIWRECNEMPTRSFASPVHRWSLQAIRVGANSLGTESLGHALRKGPPRTRRGAISAVDRHNEATAAMAAPGTPFAQEPLAQAGRGASRDPHAKAAPRHRHARDPRGSRGGSCISTYMIKEGPSGLDLAFAFTPLASGRHALLPHKWIMARTSASPRHQLAAATGDPERLLQASEMDDSGDILSCNARGLRPLGVTRRAGARAQARAE
jgi:hypothetical protein